VKREPIREKGLVGTLFREGDPSSVVIVLGGSSGGLKEERAEELAYHGFAALALAYFGVESLPSTLNRIPLEYFENAIDLLSSKFQKIGIWGVSRGAELSLILGTFFPKRIHAIAAHVPSSAVYGASDDFKTPAWSYQGKPIAPSAPFEYIERTPEGSAIEGTPLFLEGMEDSERFAQSAIPVEKIRCPLLLISAEDDQMWPSSLFAKQIVERLEAHNSPISYRHQSYPGVGHSPKRGAAGMHPVLKRWVAYGGNAKDNAFAVKDWHDQTVRFFQEHL
jgi:dienelactone hydrolase